MFPVALRCYDSQSDIDSKVSTLEKSVSEIQLTESKLNEIMKNVETQLEKHQKAISSLIDDHKAALGSNPLSLVPPITEEPVANIVVSINAEQQKEEKRQLNIIVHNLENLLLVRALLEKRMTFLSASHYSRNTWGLLCRFTMVSLR